VVGEFERPSPKNILHRETEYSPLNGGFRMVMKSGRDGTDPTEEADTPGWQVTGPALLPSDIRRYHPSENISLDTSLAINILHNP
jgi:hypothetical protein